MMIEKYEINYKLYVPLPNTLASFIINGRNETLHSASHRLN